MTSWRDDQVLWGIIGPACIKRLDEAGYAVIRRDNKLGYVGGPCPYCRSDRLITKEEDELFEEQIGCLDCNKWLTEVKLKGGG